MQRWLVPALLLILMSGAWAQGPASGGTTQVAPVATPDVSPDARPGAASASSPSEAAWAEDWGVPVDLAARTFFWLYFALHLFSIAFALIMSLGFYHAMRHWDAWGRHPARRIPLPGTLAHEQPRLSTPATTAAEARLARTPGTASL